SLVLNDELACPFLFDCITDKNPLSGALQKVLLALFFFPETADRTTMIIRYGTRLNTIMMNVDPYWLNVMMEKPEYLHYAANCESVLLRIEEGIRRPYNPTATRTTQMYFTECFNEAARILLSDAVSNRSRLEPLLGNGYLGIAHYFSMLNYQSFDTAPLFREILRLHPEWKGKFKKFTEEGPAHNPTAAYGQSLPDKSTRPKRNYVVFDEDATDL
ncbi:hypothetical protein PENTCL1PPCAC_22116, partial [Pristionchus entomophagus]